MEILRFLFLRHLNFISWRFRKYREKLNIFFLRKIVGLNFAGPAFVDHLPVVNLVKGAEIVIGRNVTLNSCNHSYHLNMAAPVKLMADEVGAKIVIGDETRVNGACIHARKRIEIGARVLVAAGSNIFDSNGHKIFPVEVSGRLREKDEPKEILIEDDVWICAGVYVLPGSKIGKGSVLAAGSVVGGTVPPYSLVSGNPAKIVKSFSEKYE